MLSAKDKRFAEMEAAIHSIQNATKHANGAANDWVLASSGESGRASHTARCSS